eukprot:3891958-Prymnesium_polylepis.2
MQQPGTRQARAAVAASSRNQRRQARGRCALELARVFVCGRRRVKDASRSVVDGVLARRVEAAQRTLHQEAAARLTEVSSERLQSWPVEDDNALLHIVMEHRMAARCPGVEHEDCSANQRATPRFEGTALVNQPPRLERRRERRSPAQVPNIRMASRMRPPASNPQLLPARGCRQRCPPERQAGRRGCCQPRRHVATIHTLPPADQHAPAQPRRTAFGCGPGYSPTSRPRVELQRLAQRVAAGAQHH